MEEQIIDHFNKASLDQVREGLTWYENANNEAKLISQTYNVPLNKVIGVMAALSPNNKWQQNIFDTWNLIETPSLETKCCTFLGQRQKALDILNSEGTFKEILTILNGTKTKNFFRNIVNYDSSNTVTVDMWAYRSVNLPPKQKFYQPIELAYQNVARNLNLLPHQLQAVVWGVVRGASI